MTAKIVIPAHEDHIFWLATHMAEDDVNECAAGGMGPYRALGEAFDRSAAAWTGMVMPDARPVLMFGVAPSGSPLSGIGSPWLLATPELRRHAIRFLKCCDQYLARMLDIFPVLVDYVDVRHRRAIAWLKWLGFRLDEKPIPLPPFGMPFYRFEMRKQWTRQLSE